MPGSPARPDPPLVAVLGGGQLGRMLGLAGVPLGLRFRFLHPDPEAPAKVAGDLVVGALDDQVALRAVAADASVVTYEWEQVPSASARVIEAGCRVLPPTIALDVTQDRLVEKRLARRLDIPTPRFVDVADRDDLERGVKEIGLPAVLKTRRGGYDGKGQAVLRGDVDIGPSWMRLGGVPLVLEEHVAFEREVSILAVRGHDGGIAYWPLVENHHAGGILRRSLAPAPATGGKLQDTAERYARRILEELGYVGVLAVELFEVRGELLVNELAPRVHNSGHWTIEGAATSQFENHLRAILGWPLGSTAPTGVSAMVNCIGALPDPETALAVSGAHFHDYGKKVREGRKLGHITVVADTRAELELRLAQLAGLPGTVE